MVFAALSGVYPVRVLHEGGFCWFNCGGCHFPFIGLYVYWGNPLAIVLCFAIGILVLWSHRSNMERLAHGTENKIGGKKAADK